MTINVNKRNEQWLSVNGIYYSSVQHEMILQIVGRKWLPDEKVWTIPYTNVGVEQFLHIFSGEKLIIDPILLHESSIFSKMQLHQQQQSTSLWSKDQEQKLIDALKVRNYSPKTIIAYRGQVARFFRFMNDTSILDYNAVIQAYSIQLLDQNRTAAYVNQAISAVKFFMLYVCKWNEPEIAFIRPKKEYKLPNVMAQNEVLRLISVISNVKHKAILLLTYSAGLRVSEVVRLQIRDINKERKTLHIRQGKGKKDRLTLLSDAAFIVVQQYIQLEQPTSWLFPGQSGRRHLNERTVQKVFDQALLAAKIH